MTAVEVLATGGLVTVQDRGRPGYGRWGVPTSGAADRSGLQLANRLVGNPEHAAALELTLGGVTLRARDRVLVALTGAIGPAWLDGRPVGALRSLLLAPGSVLRVEPPTLGLRTYLAVRGGFAVPAVLGSRATDTLSGIGPEPVRAGAVLPVGAGPVSGPPGVDVATQPYLDLVAPLRITAGPRADWFEPGALRTLTSSDYRLTAACNRVGVRLEGALLDRRQSGELDPEGMVRGAIQVPPSGAPLVFLSDHPVTGGYPVIGVVLPTDVDRLAQMRPGASVRFTVSR
ncbi:MAG: allophanate hydrolase [Blastococcus sp.]|nr:allophanate hydrolase [Blastococcus sp.]